MHTPFHKIVPVCLFGMLAANVHSQGIVNFANAIGINISTNAVANGGAVGITGTATNGFYYGLFLAPSTVRTIDLSLQDLFTPTWTFTGVYATNTGTAGRLHGDSIVPGWQPGVTNTYFILGWSSNLGHDWSTIGSELDGATFSGDAWSGGAFLAAVGNEFIGGSTSQAGGGGLPFGEPGGQAGTENYPPFNTFGLAANMQGTPSAGFTLYSVVIPEPCGLSLFCTGLLILAIRVRRNSI